ncbi:hypothetical protein [Enterococcus cecorum]|uniref:hypothetical protein n=1 Tax=Enterococcus cecorum TaxID=44008 RepID=UPI000A852C04|nr:hypothetical protein [Enterococcus cecorum]CAI3336356.1 hypothetical protein CIRMBP1309_00299 [Enterococcus cecorum]
MKKNSVLTKGVIQMVKLVLLGFVLGTVVSIIGGLNRSFWHIDLNQIKLFLQQAFLYLFFVWMYCCEYRAGDLLWKIEADRTKDCPSRGRCLRFFRR